MAPVEQRRIGLGGPALVAAVGAALFAVSCAGVAGPRSAISLNNADSGRTIGALAGDELEITLQTIGPGEYGSPVLSSGSIRFLGESSPGPQNPGGLRQLFRFEAVSTGRAEITIPHVGGFPEPGDPFTLAVDVR